MPRSGVHGSPSMWKERSDVQGGIMKEMGERETFAGRVNLKRSFF